jgi:2-polyprenyl-6-methoxyphenol hydroxylase-like FAD-dependent oxidoreductase
MSTYDAIIVGARCGGAPLAMLLARAGHKVLLVDRMTFGDDALSTHFVKRPANLLLREWGLLDQVLAKGTPVIDDLTMDSDGLRLNGAAAPIGGVDFETSPRRFLLDRILVDAAIAAGVETREKFTVTRIVMDGERAIGVEGDTPDGKTFTETARVVVGADGVQSLVAKTVGAPKVVDAGIHTCGYYGYYSGMRQSDRAASLYVRSAEKRFYITFPTNDGLDMVFLFWGAEQADRVRRDKAAAFAESLTLVPELADRVGGARLESPIVGSHLFFNHIRRAHGPGWALVGDAAIHRDPITAQGITNAFTHASILADELIKAFGGQKPVDQALADYDARQFAQLKPMFDYTVHLAMMPPPSPELVGMLPALIGDPEVRSTFMGAFLGSVPLERVFPASMIAGFAADVARAQEENRLVA